MRWSTVRSLDRSDQPEEPPPAERAGARGPDRRAPKPRELPDPEERGRVYEAMRAHASAERGDEAPPRGEHDKTGRWSYRDEVPRLLELWAKHESHWPPREQTAQDRPADPPGWADAIARIREAEPACSADAQAIEQENKEKYGGWLEGFERRLKDEDRLREKFAERLEGEPNKSPAEILRKIPDAIRLTFCFQPDNYTRGYYDIKERFEARGYEMFHSKNFWTDPEYKGINTRWVRSDGQRFEIQFHTPDSFHAKHYVTHKAYERIRDPTTSRAELSELHEFQREVSSLIEIPEGAADIPDYEKEGF
jgi:hypothetical protein